MKCLLNFLRKKEKIQFEIVIARLCASVAEPRLFFYVNFLISTNGRLIFGATCVIISS